MYGRNGEIYENGPHNKAKEESVAHAKEWGVGPSQVAEKMAKLINAAG